MQKAPKNARHIEGGALIEISEHKIKWRKN
jgi:hypothetical protein